MVNELITAIYNDTHHCGYDFIYSVDDRPQNDDEFKLHSHTDRYEILLFLSGHAQFCIEGNLYPAHPHDIFIARPFELHQNYFLSSDKYTRIMLHLSCDFFKENNCKDLEEIFLNRTLGLGCQIPAHIVDQEMCHLLFKMNQYLQEGAFSIARCVLIEFLYLLNHIQEPLTSPVAADTQINAILLYINTHLEESLTLDELSSAFYMNKYHLCRTFKKVTGYTINHYINYKRLLLAKELYLKGQTLLEASMNAGFHSYAHFYRMYRKQFGSAPKHM